MAAPPGPPAPRGRRTLPVAVGLATVLFAALLAADLPGDKWISNVGNWLAATAAAVALLIRAGRGTGRHRLGWGLLGLGVLSWAAGQAVWVWFESISGVPVPFPSPPDVGYLGLGPFAAAGVLLLPGPHQTRPVRLRSLLDGLLLAGASLLVSWYLLMRPLISASDDPDVRYAILAYPVHDVVIVTVALYLVVLLHRAGTRDPALVLLAAGMLVVGAADSGYAYVTLVGAYATGGLLDAGWFLGFGLILVAACRPAPTGPPPGPPRRPVGVLLPYGAVLAALGTAVAVEARAEGLAAVVWAVLIVLIVLRQTLTMLENGALTRDLEARVSARTAELSASEQRFRALVQQSSDVVTVVDADSVVRYQSESVERVFGWPAARLTGRTLARLLDRESGARLAAALRAVAGRPYGSTVLELTVPHRDRRQRQAEMTVTNLLDDPNVRGLVLNTRDITERRQLQEQLVHEAHHDPLTQLANRSLFVERIGEALQGRRSTDHVAVVVLDLDGFKEVNDALGHAAGDQLLVQVADRLHATVRTGDTVARLGGDEFAVLAHAADAPAVARRVVTAMAEPFVVDGREVHVGASAGIAAAGAGVDAVQLMRNADLAMYQAKSAGGGDVAVYHPSLHAGLVERLQLEADLRRALDRGELRLFYQPCVDLADGATVGYEALVRWLHPERGLVPPGEFIAVAEQIGVIGPLGRWVLEQACRQAVEWAAEGRPVRMAVNVSVRQFHRTDLSAEVGAVLAATGLPADRLCLEMTESVLMTDTDANLAQLTRLKQLGVHLAVDDFGTGYSSLAYLRRFPVDVIKIDRSFVDRICDTDDAATLVHTIVQLGRSLGMTTVAEGVEHGGQLDALRAMGCELAQGYHFSRPVPAEVAARLLVGFPDRVTTSMGV
jgi:diguanylate cyclase (GGDEF)-like protein/PAS domain S-box-containing protein